MREAVVCGGTLPTAAPRQRIWGICGNGAGWGHGAVEPQKAGAAHDPSWVWL